MRERVHLHFAPPLGRSWKFKFNSDCPILMEKLASIGIVFYIKNYP